VSRRGRALGFLVAAVVCALLAAMVAAGYRSRVDGRWGELRPVVVAARDLPAGRPLGPAALESLSVRRVPARFAPPGALRGPAEALGRAPAAPVPAGAYLLASQLELPRAERPRRPALAGGRRPVQLRVTGAGALLVGGGGPEGGRVDVVVSRSPGLGRRAHTWVAASRVPVLALDRPTGPGEGWTATLGLTRSEALELISADASGRQIRLLPRAP
jgi:Flp pilus assembly protein CpaB